jgi:hypothetical protein
MFQDMMRRSVPRARGLAVEEVERVDNEAQCEKEDV